jgi:hypothetical protein
MTVYETLAAVRDVLVAAGLPENVVEHYMVHARGLRDGGPYARPPSVVIVSDRETGPPSHRLLVLPEGYGLEPLSAEEERALWDEVVRPRRGSRTG